MALFKTGLTNAGVQKISDAARLRWEKLYYNLPDKEVLPEGPGLSRAVAHTMETANRPISSAQSFNIVLLTREKKKIIYQLVEMHLVEWLMANSRLFQLRPICCSCTTDKPFVVSMKWLMSQAQITAFLYSVRLFSISIFKTRGQNTIESIFVCEQATSKANHILASRASLQ